MTSKGVPDHTTAERNKTSRHRSKKLRALITFHPRKSHFDTTNESSGSNEFRGFFTLFWITLFLFSIQTYVSSFEVKGYALSFALASLFSRDAIVLALSDAVLVLVCALCVPIARARSKGWTEYRWSGIVLQHAFQACVLAGAITWTYHRQWPWVQSGFLTLHSFVMIMKMHSYISANGYLQDVFERAQQTLADLRSLTAEPSIGGWDKAILDAQTRLDLESKKPHGDAIPEITMEIDTQGTKAAVVSTSNGQDSLRKRVVNALNGSVKVGEDVTALDSSALATFDGMLSLGGSDAPPASVSALVHHPYQPIATLAHEFLELDAELVSMSGRVKYPNNLDWKSFCIYMLSPTLVYELEYPCTDRIRPLYVFEKTVAFVGSFALLYTVTESFIIPLTPTPDQSFFRSLLDLALPFMISYLLLFYIIFECICNAFAELTYFADRQFYDDWWNSTSWDEYSRKWNKPVYQFLLRHVYASSLASYPSLSRSGAMFVTFLLSAAAHELVMIIVTRKIRFYLFVMQLLQIPLIYVSRATLKQNHPIGNVAFWLGLYTGFPLLCVAYVAY